MKLTEVGLSSFKCFAGLVLPVDRPRVYLCSVNGAGKTSTREAIRWVLTGKAQGLDGKGAGADRLIPNMNGAKGVQASVTIAGLGVVERAWTPTGSTLRVQGFTGNSTEQQAALYEKLQTTEPFIHAAIDNAHILDLAHADAKAMVLELLDVRIEGVAADGAVSLSELDEMYKQAFEDRKIAKKELNAHRVPPPPVQPDHSSLEDIDALLVKRRGELEALIGQGGSVGGQREALERRRFQLNPLPIAPTLPPDVSDQIADLEERLAIMEAEPEPEKASAIATADDFMREPAYRVEVLRNRAEAIAKHKPSEGCVLDAEIPCETAKLRFSKRLKALKGEIEALPQPSAPPVTDPVTGPSLSDLRRQLKDLQMQQRRYEQAKEAHDTRQADLGKIEAELSTLGDTSGRDAEIADLRGRITKGEQYRAEAERFWKASEAHQKALEQGQALRAEVDRLEQLCDVLGPSGARVQALQQKLGDFEAAINAFTGPFGWTVQFNLEPWDVIVNGRPVDTYSKSERYLVGVAIQMAVARLSGLNFVVVDELDILLAKPRNVLQSLIWQAPMEQVIILSSREPDRALPPTTPGLVSYRLGTTDHGSVVTETA
jgi:exonuclease SbcC